MPSAKPKERPAGEKVIAIVKAVEDVELTDMAAWNDLNALSSHTYVDGIEVDPAGVIVDKTGRFNGVANIYVLLEYGQGADAFQTTESFLGRFHGHMDDGGKPVVEDVSVDTSPFFRGEAVS